MMITTDSPPSLKKVSHHGSLKRQLQGSDLCRLVQLHEEPFLLLRIHELEGGKLGERELLGGIQRAGCTPDEIAHGDLTLIRAPTRLLQNIDNSEHYLQGVEIFRRKKGRRRGGNSSGTLLQ